MAIFLIFSLILIIMSVLIISKKNYRGNRIILFYTISFVGMLILSGFRGLNIGTDTYMYVNYYNRIQGIKDISVLSNRFELGYRIYNCILKEMFSSAHALLIMSTLVTLVLFYFIIIKLSKAPWYSILMFVFLMYYYNSMCLLRQYIAMMLCCVAFLFLSDKKIVKYLLITLLAISFHSSSAISLIMLPLMYVKLNKKRRLLYILLSMITCFAFNKGITLLIVVMPKYDSYLTSNYYMSNKIGIILKIIVWICMFILVDYSYFKKAEVEKCSKIDDIGYFSALLSVAITTIALDGAILERMSYYFSIMYCLSVPNALYIIKRQKLRYQLGFLIIFSCIIYNMVILILRPYWSGVIPYTFWG